MPPPLRIGLCRSVLRGGPAPRADIALSIIDVVIPPGSDWIAFQFESEPEEGGESGAWVASQTFLKPVVGAIGDRVWSDSNQNCLQDAGEAGIGAVTVTLFDDGGNAIASTETAADGSYVFSGLLAGSYSVEFDVPTGFELTEPNCTDDLRDSDAVLTDAGRGRTGTIVLPGGSSDFSVDAGLITAPPPTTVPVTTVPVTTVPTAGASGRPGRSAAAARQQRQLLELPAALRRSGDDPGFGAVVSISMDTGPQSSPVNPLRMTRHSLSCAGRPGVGTTVG